jgi:hypothetical protein
MKVCRARPRQPAETYRRRARLASSRPGAGRDFPVLTNAPRRWHARAWRVRRLITDCFPRFPSIGSGRAPAAANARLAGLRRGSRGTRGFSETRARPPHGHSAPSWRRGAQRALGDPDAAARRASRDPRAQLPEVFAATRTPGVAQTGADGTRPRARPEPCFTRDRELASSGHQGHAACLMNCGRAAGGRRWPLTGRGNR